MCGSRSGKRANHLVRISAHQRATSSEIGRYLSTALFSQRCTVLLFYGGRWVPAAQMIWSSPYGSKVWENKEYVRILYWEYSHLFVTNHGFLVGKMTGYSDYWTEDLGTDRDVFSFSKLSRITRTTALPPIRRRAVSLGWKNRDMTTQGQLYYFCVLHTAVLSSGNTPRIVAWSVNTKLIKMWQETDMT
jgi:hypothetical protein